MDGRRGSHAWEWGLPWMGAAFLTQGTARSHRREPRSTCPGALPSRVKTRAAKKVRHERRGRTAMSMGRNDEETKG